MPREHKRRGRREEDRARKRKLATTEDGEEDEREHSQDDGQQHKRHKTGNGEAQAPVEACSHAESAPPATGDHDHDAPFYGLLDPEEQEHFRAADEELDQLQDPEERAALIARVFADAKNKELKMANSQSCSRLMEKLILLASHSQIKALYQQFTGHFISLIDHRFASHCCEALFRRAASIVSSETREPTKIETGGEEVFVSMENLVLHTLNELEGSFGYLVTARYASHVLRVLLTVLAGMPLSNSEKPSPLKSKRKETVAVTGGSQANGADQSELHVPESFELALQALPGKALSGMETTALRALATHSTGSPTLALLIRIELTKFGKQWARDEGSVMHRLLPDDPIIEGTDSAAFINGLVYDAVGSRLLETIVEFAPGKVFKNLYRAFFHDRLGALARNENACHIVSKVIERLSAEDLTEAVEVVTPHMVTLVELNRTLVIKTLIERCEIRQVDNTAIARQLQTAYDGPNGFDIARLLRLGESAPDSSSPNKRPSQFQPGKVHGSLLAQAMVSVPGQLGSLIFDSLARLGSPLSLKAAKDPTASRALQAALTSPHASIIFQRKVIQQFYGHFGEMALDPSASHVVDAIWSGTQGLAFIRERIAEELAENEASLRDSFPGRAVWKNWKMELYKRRRADWVKMSRRNAESEAFVPFPETAGSERQKTPLELAREKHAVTKVRQERAIHKAQKLSRSSRSKSSASAVTSTLPDAPS